MNSTIEHSSLTNEKKPKLSDEQNTPVNMPLNIAELSHALRDMKNNKSPGLDGFTTNFYNFFGQTSNWLF